MVSRTVLSKKDASLISRTAELTSAVLSEKRSFGSNSDNSEGRASKSSENSCGVSSEMPSTDCADTGVFNPKSSNRHSASMLKIEGIAIRLPPPKPCSKVGAQGVKAPPFPPAPHRLPRRPLRFPDKRRRSIASARQCPVL